MDRIVNIRSRDVARHVDLERSTWMNSLICKSGIIYEKKTVNARLTDMRTDELECGVTDHQENQSLVVL